MFTKQDLQQQRSTIEKLRHSSSLSPEMPRSSVRVYLVRQRSATAEIPKGRVAAPLQDLKYIPALLIP